MRYISQTAYVKGKGHRRVTKRFFLFVAIALIIASALFLLSRAFPIEISKAADGAMIPPVEAQGVVEVLSGDDDGTKKVIIDPGHGDSDVGTRGVSTDRLEKEVNLEIALKLKDILQQKGYTVIMTRDSDEPIAAANEPDAKVRKRADMEKRENIIKESNADIFVSIHQNFFDGGSGARGPQVFYHDRGAKGYELAQYVQDELNTRLGIKNPRDINSGDYQLLRPGNQASIIVECGFFSNPEEEKKLQKDDYQQTLAQAVGEGIEQYLSNK